jgi:hypothetical protein
MHTIGEVAEAIAGNDIELLQLIPEEMKKVAIDDENQLKKLKEIYNKKRGILVKIIGNEEISKQDLEDLKIFDQESGKKVEILTLEEVGFINEVIVFIGRQLSYPVQT